VERGVRTPGVEMVERLLVVVDISVLSVVEPAVVLAAVVCGNIVRSDVDNVDVALSVVYTVTVSLTRGVDFLVAKVVVDDDDVMLLSVTVLTSEVDFVVLRTGDVDGEDVISGVGVRVAAVELAAEVIEETANSLLDADILNLSSGFEVVILVDNGEVMLETVDEEVVMTPGIDFVIMRSGGVDSSGAVSGAVALDGTFIGVEDVGKMVDLLLLVNTAGLVFVVLIAALEEDIRPDVDDVTLVLVDSLYAIKRVVVDVDKMD